METASHVRTTPRLTWWRIALCLIAVCLLGLVVPGGGLILAVVLWFTALRPHRPIAVAALLLGSVLALGAAFGLSPVTSQSSTESEPSIVTPGD